MNYFRPINYFLPVLTMIICFYSCSTEYGGHYVGSWQTDKYNDGTSIMVTIDKDVDIYKVHKFIVDANGEILEGRSYPNETFFASLENDILQVTAFDKIAYSEKDEKLRWSKWQFHRVN